MKQRTGKHHRSRQRRQCLGSRNWLIGSDLPVTDGDLMITNEAGFAGIVNAIRISTVETASVPVPLTALLFASGLAGIGLIKRKSIA